MSHFCGLVILTPKYSESFGMDDSLAKYDENLEVPEYRECDVSDYDKVRFLQHYCQNETGSINTLSKFFYEKQDAGMRGQMEAAFDKQYDGEPLSMHDSEEKWDKFYKFIYWTFKAEFAKWFKNKFRKVWRSFDEQYAKNGEDWNDNSWRKDEKGVWAVYSTYNPDSKWDWYSIGGRWSNSIKTKSGEFVDMAKLDEIDFEPYPDECFEDSTDWRGEPIKQLKDEYEWHYDNKDNVPFCVIIDGVWYERGEMGWWACVSNEKNKEDWSGEVNNLLKDLPAETMVYSVDFHI